MASPISTEPPDHFSGDIYAARICLACRTRSPKQRSASVRATSPKRAFGDDVVEHYLHFYRSEQRAYDMAVTDWEIQRYFERI